jgi:hypothetical protein
LLPPSGNEKEAVKLTSWQVKQRNTCLSIWRPVIVTRQEW